MARVARGRRRARPRLRPGSPELVRRAHAVSFPDGGGFSTACEPAPLSRPRRRAPPGSRAAPPAPAAPVDAEGAARCRIAAKQERPLVTEWAGSEKADLESRLSSGQVVAVRYTGCELQIVEACRVSGKYAFRRTTLSTDTVEISDADDLYAKLPLGAVGLEGELAWSGRLAVRTTVAGEYRLDAAPAGACPSSPDAPTRRTS